MFRRITWYNMHASGRGDDERVKRSTMAHGRLWALDDGYRDFTLGAGQELSPGVHGWTGVVLEQCGHHLNYFFNL